VNLILREEDKRDKEAIKIMMGKEIIRLVKKVKA